MNYNQQITTTNKVCTIETSAGFCGGWTETQTTTFSYFNFLYLLLWIGGGIFIIYKIAKRK
jgi:hypothetical protein